MSFYEFLPKLLNMSMTASLIILAVLMVRLLLKKAPKVFSYALWAVVLFRLLCPVSVSSDFSLLGVFQVPVAENGALEYIPANIVHTEYPQVTLPSLKLWADTNEEALQNSMADGTKAEAGGALSGEQGSAIQSNEQGNMVQSDAVQVGIVDKEQSVDTQNITDVAISETERSTGEISVGTSAGFSFLKKLEMLINKQLPQGSEQLGADPLEAPITIATYIWGLGALLLILYNLMQLWRLREKLEIAEPLKQNIYLADHIDTAFVMGLVRPKIYLPSNLKEQERSYIIMHEQYHIHRGDHVVKVLAFAALCIHWFNPLVWLAFLLATKDMEMSCDEAVMRQMEQDIRAEYAESLLQFATGKRLIAGAPLAFGEGDTKARVKNVMHYKKPALWMVLIAVVVCVVAVVCLMTNPKEKSDLPLDKTYNVSQTVYFNQRCEENVYTDDTADYYFAESGEVYYRWNVWNQAFREWIPLGNMAEVTLTENNFDAYFYNEVTASDYDRRELAAELRSNNVKAWKIVSEEERMFHLSYYLLQQENGEVYLAGWFEDSEKGIAFSEDDSYMEWIVKLEAVDEEAAKKQSAQVEPVYYAKECRYMNLLSSYMPVNGDSGYLYRIEEEAFVKINKNSGGETRIEIEEWAWQEFPYTDEEWTALYFPDLGSTEMLSKYYTEMLYQPLDGRDCLMKMDGELWLVTIADDPKAGTYIWSIYVLAPVQEGEGSQVIERQPGDSSSPIEEGEAGTEQSSVLEIVIGETYRTSEQLAMSYDTDTYLLDDDSGYFYQIEEDALVMINKVDGSQTRIPVAGWEWQEFPYTEEEWNRAAERSGYLQNLQSRVGEVKYLPVGEEHFLLLLNDMLVLGEYVEFRTWEYEVYVGDVYTLVPKESNIETDVIVKGYELDYQEGYTASYSAEEWFTEEGGVEYPAAALILDPDSTLSERFSRYYMPQEVLEKAETVELLRLAAQWPMTSYNIYNFICYYLDFLTGKFNGADELIHRPDLAEAALKELQETGFMMKRDLPDKEEQSAYNKQCYAQVKKIALAEILLASNRAFDQMDEEMKQEVLAEALKKVEQRQSKRFVCSDMDNASLPELSSGFFSYILEQKEAGGSKWYQYLVETGEDELVEKLDMLSPYECRP